MPSEDGPWTLEWNGENRLIAMETAGPAVDPVRLTFTYDYMGRRVRKRSHSGSAIIGWTLDQDLRYIYNNWNIIAQFSLQPSSLIPDKTYTWGLDPSQTLPGAGGVGGLLSVSDLGPPTSDLWHPTYDANTESGRTGARYCSAASCQTRLCGEKCLEWHFGLESRY